MVSLSAYDLHYCISMLCMYDLVNVLHYCISMLCMYDLVNDLHYCINYCRINYLLTSMLSDFIINLNIRYHWYYNIVSYLLLIAYMGKNIAMN